MKDKVVMVVSSNVNRGLMARLAAAALAQGLAIDVIEEAELAAKAPVRERDPMPDKCEKACYDYGDGGKQRAQWKQEVGRHRRGGR